MPDSPVITPSSDPSNPGNAASSNPLATTPAQMASSTPDTTGPQTPPVPSASNPPPAQAPIPQAPPSVPAPAPGLPAQPKPGSVANPAPAKLSTGAATAPTTPAQDQWANHPAVQKASLMSSIARTLAGNPQTVTIDPTTGATTRTPAPLSGRQIALAIALQVLGGAAAGAAVKPGPGVLGRAAGAGFAQGESEVEERNAAQEAKAQQDVRNEQQSYALKATLAHLNAETAQLAALAQNQSVDSMQKIIDSNRASGVILDPDDPLLDSRDPLPENVILQRMQDGSLSGTDHIGSMVAISEVRGEDGRLHAEPLFQVIHDPSAKVDVDPSEWDYWRSIGVRGIPQKNPDRAIQIPYYMKVAFSNQAASHVLAQQRLDDMRVNLAGTPSASLVPVSIDWSAPGVDSAMSAMKRYISHNATNLADPYLALQQMGADRRDPKTGVLQPNPDSKYVDTIAQALGGWNVLLTNHNQIEANKKLQSDYAIIDTADKANAVLSAPNKFTPAQRQAANVFIHLSQQQGEQKAAEEARERAIATGEDVQAMYRFGRNPITGEQLSLTNAPDAMLVDAQGRVIPQDLVSTYKPSSNEKQTADTARQVLAISANLQKAVQQNPNLIGPLLGRSREGLAKAGLGNAASQQLLDNLSFLQSAATKMHTGRFSNEILEKMGNLIKPGMNPAQFQGALNSINDVAARYAQEDKLITVGDYKQMQNGIQQITNKLDSGNVGLTNIQVNPKTGQRIGWNGSAWVDATTGVAVQAGK